MLFGAACQRAIFYAFWTFYVYTTRTIYFHWFILFCVSLKIFVFFFSFLFSVPLSFESGRIESLGITFLFVKILILWKHINISLPFSCIFCCCSSLHWFIYYCNLLLRFDLNKCDEPEANVNSKSNVGKGTKK